jgi:hypothetical protein
LVKAKGANADSRRGRPSAAVWSTLKLLAAIALELASCVEARTPIPPERIKAMRAFERDLEKACNGGTTEVPIPSEDRRTDNASVEYNSACLEFLE